MSDALSGSTILFVVNTDWFFLSHRLPLALRARAAGATVVVAATDTGRAEEIRAHGLGFEDLAMSRIGRNPLPELRTLLRLVRIMRRHEPDLAHLVATKSLVYGGVAARLTGVRAVVSAVTGAGYALSPERSGPVQQLVRRLLRRTLSWSSAIIFQHRSDLDLYVGSGLAAAERCAIVAGVGVEPDDWPARPEPAEPVVLLAARMILDKGIGTFAEAAALVRRHHPEARFVLVGPLEPDLPSAVPVGALEGWQRSGILEWWGARRDMPEVFSQATIFVLPTYHNEGVPKVLLEAGASGRAVIASDIPGCRAVVDDGRTGLIVPIKDADVLASAIMTLLSDSVKRRDLAEALHDDVITRFRESDLSDATLRIYRGCLARE